jgi:amino acid transporter
MVRAHSQGTSRSSGTLGAPQHSGGLARNVLGLWDGVVLGFASAAPGVSVAGVLGGLAGVSGYGAVLALLVGFLPLVCIAFGFFHLNRWRADVGISYAWIGRILSPAVGAFVGVLMLICFVVSNSFSLIPAATNFLSLFSASAAASHLLVTLFGTMALVIITGLVVAGIRLAARFQWAVSGFEMLVLVVFGVLALARGLHGHRTGVSGTAMPSLTWFSLHAAGGGGGLAAGLLIAVFWYSGWETAVVVNEETRRARVNPGLAGIGGLIGVVVISVVLAMLFFADVSPAAMASNAGWLTQTALNLAGRPWGYVLTLAIMLGYLGGIETTIITFGNVGYSMGRDGVIWRVFATVSDRTKMPWIAILVLTVPSYIIFLLQVWASGANLAGILADLASSLGLMFVVYYALTGIASAWMLRAVAMRSAWTAVTGVLLPLAGAAMLVWIGVKSWAETATPVKITWLVAMTLSAVAVVVSRFLGKSGFYRQLLRHPVSEADLQQVESS